jgi:hypothetical protein
MSFLISLTYQLIRLRCARENELHRFICCFVPLGDLPRRAANVALASFSSFGELLVEAGDVALKDARLRLQRQRGWLFSPSGIAGAGRSELYVSTIHFHLPSDCFFQTSRSLPVSLIAGPPFGSLIES